MTERFSSGLSRLLLVFSLLTLAACASTPEKLTQKDEWRVRGKFVFQTDDTRESGNFDWRQTGENYQVRFFGPLGFGSVRINGDQQQATVVSSRGEKQSSLPNDLIYEITGVDIPLTDVPSWLEGKPIAFHSEYAELDANGDIEAINVHGWQLTYQRFDDGSRRPKQIVAVQNNTRIKLVSLNWR